MDLYIVRLMDKIPLATVRNVPATSTTARKLRIYGRNFTRAVEIVVNSMSITSGWVLLKPTEIEVSLPTPLQTATINSVQVFSDSIHDLNVSRLVPGIGVGQFTHRMQAAIQLLYKWLFTTPGSDPYHPNEGGGWNTVPGVPDNDIAAVVSYLTDGLERVKTFLLRLQAADPGIPDDERIASVDVLSSSQTSRGISMELRVTTVSGNITDVRIL